MRFCLVDLSRLADRDHKGEHRSIGNSMSRIGYGSRKAPLDAKTWCSRFRLTGRNAPAASAARRVRAAT